MVVVDVPTTKRVKSTCSCAKCGRTMQVSSIKPHERKSCPVRRFSEILELPGERKATDAQRGTIRELYDAKVILPMPPELAEGLESASHEAAERLIRWLRGQKPAPGKAKVPKRYQPGRRVECSQCGALVNHHYLREHMQKACLGSKKAREAHATQQVHKRKHKCSECGHMMTPGSRQRHIKTNCPVTRLSAFLERVGRMNATEEQRKEVRELYAARVALPMPPRLDEALEETSSEVAEQITCWLRRRSVRPSEEMKA